MKIVLSECITTLKRESRYRLQFFSDLLFFTFVIILFLSSQTGTSFSIQYDTSTQFAPTLLLFGYITWTFSSISVAKIAYAIQNDRFIGVFYQKLFSSVPLWVIYLGRLLSSIILQAFSATILIIIAVLIFKVPFAITPIMVLALLVNMIGIYGIGLIIGGLAIYLQRVNTIVFITQTLLIMLTNTLPTPTAVLSITKFVPLTICNEILRKSFLHQPVFNDFVFLSIVSFLFLFVGVIVFQSLLKAGKKKGNLLYF